MNMKNKRAKTIILSIVWITVCLFIGSLLLSKGSFAWDSNLGGGTRSLQQKWNRGGSYRSSSSRRITSSIHSSASASIPRGTVRLPGSSSGVISPKSSSSVNSSSQVKGGRVVTSMNKITETSFNNYLDSKTIEGEKSHYYNSSHHQGSEQKAKSGYVAIGSDKWRVNIVGAGAQQKAEETKEGEEKEDDEN
ncbi:MAG: hypothetical protein ACTSR2_08795 [Candidatus Hodarchaeales archaeon]